MEMPLFSAAASMCAMADGSIKACLVVNVMTVVQPKFSQKAIDAKLGTHKCTK
jgi:hypothetical protein